MGLNSQCKVQGAQPQSSDMVGGDIETSICLNCGHMPGAWLPGLPCPECGEPML